jgi:ubiquinone/menaquinone biosynthesis C-methylase UbiE
MTQEVKTMPDLYATITQVDAEIQERLASVLELRASEPQQQEMLKAYLSEVDFPSNARVLEVGCGTGAVSRALAAWPSVGSVVGVDPSAIFLAKARELAAGLNNIRFEEADGRALPFTDGEYDVVVFHTSLCHIPNPELALAEANRLLRPGGLLVIFDGDYVTTSVAIGDFDPLQACVDASVSALVHDRWLVRKLQALVRSAGFTILRFRSHGYVQMTEPTYMLTIADRGADILAATGCISIATATALKEEARRRVQEGMYFGHIAYASLIGQRDT